MWVTFNIQKNNYTSSLKEYYLSQYLLTFPVVMAFMTEFR